MAGTRGDRKPDRSPGERRRWLSAQFDSNPIGRDEGVRRVYIVTGGRDNMKSEIYDDKKGVGGSVRGKSVRGGYPLSDYAINDPQSINELMENHKQRDAQCARDIESFARSAARMMDLRPGDVVLLPTFGIQNQRDTHLVDGQSIALGAPAKLNMYIANKDGVERHAWCNVTSKFYNKPEDSFMSAVFDRARRWHDHELCVVAFPEAWNGLDTNITLWKDYDPDPEKSDMVQLHEHFNTRRQRDVDNRMRNVARLLETLDTCKSEGIPCYAVGNRGTYVQLLSCIRTNADRIAQEMDRAKMSDHKRIIADLGVSTDVDEMLGSYFRNRIAPVGGSGETIEKVDQELIGKMSVSVMPTSVPGMAPADATEKVVVKVDGGLDVDVHEPKSYDDGFC
jgi:hypothetical protein